MENLLPFNDHVVINVEQRNGKKNEKKTIKYERVYLYAYDSVGEARTSIMDYLAWYNQARPHSKLNKMTPDEAYQMMLPALTRAA